MNILAHQSVRIGNSFEHLIDLSLSLPVNREIIHATHLPQSGAKFTGKNHVHPLPIDCDYHGAQSGTGRAVFFDAKSCDEKYRFPMSKVSEHQRAFLRSMGQAGAISGVLVRASCPDVQFIFWVPWYVLSEVTPSVEWTDERLIEVGPDDTTIDFRFIEQCKEASHAA